MRITDSMSIGKQSQSPDNLGSLETQREYVQEKVDVWSP